MVKPEFVAELRKAEEQYVCRYNHLPKPENFVGQEMNARSPYHVFLPPSYYLRDETGYIYFLKDDFVHPNLMKVGYTNDLKQRLKQFKTVLPCPRFVAIIPGSKSMEQEMHDLLKFEGKHSFREWFIMDIQSIQSLCNIYWDFDRDYPVVYL